MSAWTKIPRDIACAHLGDLSTRAFRDGDTARGITLLGCAQEVAYQPDPEHYYREGLAWSEGLLTNDEDAVARGDAAVAAVLRGECPPGSLPAQFRTLWAAEDKIVRGRRNPFFTPHVGRRPLVERLRALLVANAAHCVLQLLGGAQEQAEIEPLTAKDSITAEGIFDVVRLREEDHDVVRAWMATLPRCAGDRSDPDHIVPCEEPPVKTGPRMLPGLPLLWYCDAHGPVDPRDLATEVVGVDQFRVLIRRVKSWSKP